MLNCALTVAQSWESSATMQEAPGKVRLNWLPRVSRTPHQEGSVEKNSCNLKRSASLPGCKRRLWGSEVVTGNSGGRPWCWGIADRPPVASVPLVSLNVVKGPEGDGESLPVIDRSPPASSV